MMEERYHATTQNRFYPDMSNVNKNITVEAKLINPLTYIQVKLKQSLCRPTRVPEGSRRLKLPDFQIIST